MRFIREIFNTQVRLSGFLARTIYDSGSKGFVTGEIQDHDPGLCAHALRKWSSTLAHPARARLQSTSQAIPNRGVNRRACRRLWRGGSVVIRNGEGR